MSDDIFTLSKDSLGFDDVQTNIHHYRDNLLASLSNPKQGVSPLKWGYYFWRMLHYCFIGITDPVPRQDMDRFMDLTMQSLPCSICRNSFAIFRSIMLFDVFHAFSPLYAPALYFFCAHEWVNLKRGVYERPTPTPSSSSSLPLSDSVRALVVKSERKSEKEHNVPSLSLFAESEDQTELKTIPLQPTPQQQNQPQPPQPTSLHAVEIHDRSFHGSQEPVSSSSSSSSSPTRFETIHPFATPAVSLDMSKRLCFSEVYTQYIHIDRVEIVNDFFMVCFFVIEHYPDLDLSNPKSQETRRVNAAFVQQLTRFFASRLFQVPQRRDFQKGYSEMNDGEKTAYEAKQARQCALFIEEMEQKLDWETQNSVQLLESVYKLEQKLLHHPIPLRVLMMCLQSNVVSH